MFQKFDKVIGFLYGAFIVALAIAVIKGICLCIPKTPAGV